MNGRVSSGRMLNKSYASLLWFPLTAIIAACLFSLFPHYHTLFMHVIGLYVFVIFFAWMYARDRDDETSKKKSFVYCHYFYASILIILMVKMSFDIKTYYAFTGERERLDKEYKKGDPDAAFRLATFYREREELPRTVSRAAVLVLHEKWLRTYLRESINSKNTSRVSDIKSLGKFYIRGADGSGYTSAHHTNLGIELYQGAHKLGDPGALAELRQQLSGAKRRMKQEIETLKRTGNDTGIRGMEKRMRDLDMVRLR